jgi:hypothetical protein
VEAKAGVPTVDPARRTPPLSSCAPVPSRCYHGATGRACEGLPRRERCLRRGTNLLLVPGIVRRCANACEAWFQLPKLRVAGSIPVVRFEKLPFG